MKTKKHASSILGLKYRHEKTQTFMGDLQLEIRFTFGANHVWCSSCLIRNRYKILKRKIDEYTGAGLSLSLETAYIMIQISKFIQF